MFYSLLSIFSMFALFGLMLVMIALGHYVGRNKTSEAGISVAEGAVFTLMALLVAFTFGSANQRFDERRIVIVDESNAIGTAYLRLDMFEVKDRTILREDFRAYVSARLAIYNAVPDFKAVAKEIAKAKEIQEKLWQDAIVACKNNPTPFVSMLILPSINTMFDIANTRTAFSYLHPPVMVFCLLLVVAFLSAFLMGYGMSGKGEWRSLHVIAFSLICALTIFIIVDIEFPRLGLIKETAFDRQLLEVKNDMSAEHQ